MIEKVRFYLPGENFSEGLFQRDDKLYGLLFKILHGDFGLLSPTDFFKGEPNLKELGVA